jgi:poly(3-hydroxybutyrate) depolymerase
MRVPHLLSIVALTAVLSPARAAQDGPSAKEIDALVEEYFQHDWKSPEGIARHDEILALLADAPPLDESRVKKWKKTLLKHWGKGPKLDKKGGRRYLWEEPRRKGLYILGGKEKSPKGLFLGMHGGGVGSGDAGKSHGAYSSAVGSEKWLGIFPEVIEKTECGWTDAGTEEFCLELIDRAIRTWKIDRDHIYFGGHSMGGYGSWTLGAHHADMVAALMPSAGAPTPIMNREGEATGIVEGVVPNLRNVRMVVFQSTDDPQVPPDANQAAAKEVEEARAKYGGYENFEYWEVTGVGHGFPVGGIEELIDKIADAERPPLPDKVVWQPDLSWKRHFYWLWWDSPRQRAIVVAEVDRETNSIHVEVRGKSDGLYVLLNDELVDMKREVVVTAGAREVFRGVPQRSLVALLSTGVRGDERLMFDARIPLNPTE